MSFLADVLTEDIFFENLTLGLTKLLDHTPEIGNIESDRRQPCERMQLSSWEQRYSCVLPTDLRQFYLSTDGFKLTWSFRHAGKHRGSRYIGELLPVGNLKINGISELKRLAGVKSQGDSDCPTLLDIEIGSSQSNKPNFGVKCKIFEIDACQGGGRVCLVYLDKQESQLDTRDDPRIWLLDRSLEWHILAETFLQYFRMMLVHQGLPQWQFRFTPMGLTPFAEKMMSLVAPHLLHTGLNTSESLEGELNQIDPNIFKTSRSKSTKKKEIKGCKN